MDFETSLSKHFPSVIAEDQYVRRTYAALVEFGLNADNTIACVDVCRDELTAPFLSLVKKQWGEAFNLSSLAGLFFAGRTALLSAMQHAPNAHGSERYVLYVLPHIALGADGGFGVCRRRVRAQDSNACGALESFRTELAAGKLELRLDHEDVEQSLLRSRLLRELRYGHVPDLVELTRCAQHAGQVDLEKAIHAVAKVHECEHAVMTGIQIHAPSGTLVSPNAAYYVAAGHKHRVDLHGRRAQG